MRPITNQSQGRHATMLLIPINSNEFFRILMDFVNTRIYFVSILCPKQNLFSIIICQPLLFALKSLIIVRNEVAKVMFLHQSVCPRGGGSASVHQAPRHPPGPGTPRGPGTPLSCREQATSPGTDGTHPTGMHSCSIISVDE